MCVVQLVPLIGVPLSHLLEFIQQMPRMLMIGPVEARSPHLDRSGSVQSSVFALLSFFTEI